MKKPTDRKQQERMEAIEPDPIAERFKSMKPAKKHVDNVVRDKEKEQSK